jgi:hypothetical protein
MTAMDSSAHLAEYEKLKEEQGQRIHFRDNMRYVMLVASGFMFAKASDIPFALLAIPWVCSVLGWTYVANSRKVFNIRNYLETELLAKVGPNYFGWEKRQRKSDHCRRILIDEITFVGPGLVALIVFPILTDAYVALAWAFVPIGAALLLWIGWEIANPHESRTLTKALVNGFLKGLLQPRGKRLKPDEAAAAVGFSPDQLRTAIGSA